MFSIEIKRLYWLGDNDDEPMDLCLHGELSVRIGDELIEASCTVSVTALYLLRTLTEDYTPGCYHPGCSQIMPCCGHTMFANEKTESVEILGCGYGEEWAVHHARKSVELMTEQGTRTLVPLEEYRETVLAFADQVLAYYMQCRPKILPEEDFERDGYLAFWREWARRRDIAVEDTPIGAAFLPPEETT